MSIFINLVALRLLKLWSYFKETKPSESIFGNIN